MKVNFFITKDGILKRKQNTVYFVRNNEEGKMERRILPIEKIYSIYAHGRLSFSSGVVSYLSKHGVPIHFFGKYENYEGSYYPREKLLSGDLLIKQVGHYTDHGKRLRIARELIRGCAENVIKNLQYYDRTGKETADD